MSACGAFLSIIKKEDGLFYIFDHATDNIYFEDQKGYNNLKEAENKAKYYQGIEDDKLWTEFHFG